MFGEWCKRENFISVLQTMFAGLTRRSTQRVRRLHVCIQRKVAASSLQQPRVDCVRTLFGSIDLRAVDVT